MKVWKLVVPFALIYASAAVAGEFGSYTVVKLNYGANQVDFNNDGVNDLIVLAKRENFNAHGFDVVTFYFRPALDWAKSRWDIIPIYGMGNEQLTLQPSGGADCLLHDFRIMKPKTGNQALLIVANRKMTDSYFEKNSVSFDYFTLEYNSEGEAGAPAAFFRRQKTVQSKRQYCDVNEAFRSELGLGNYMGR